MTEREWDRHLHIRTIGREDETDPNRSPYEPTPYSVLARVAASGHIKRRHHLLDYGCGKGRVAFFMAAEVGCRVTGIDHSEKLIDMARENRRAARLGDRVTFIRGLAEQYEPRDEDAFFFFNPFSEKVFECVLRRIEHSWRDLPRPMILLCYYPSDAWAACLEASPLFEPADEIDCNGLFSGRFNSRERVIVYRTKTFAPA